MHVLSIWKFDLDKIKNNVTIIRITHNRFMRASVLMNP